MISSLEDAWGWYQSVLSLTQVMGRLGSKYWQSLPWDGPMGRDNRLRPLEATEIAEKAKAVLQDLEDLGVLVLFSVFESIVRNRALADVAAESHSLSHPALLHAVKALSDAIENGSVSKVLEAYKGLDANLVEEVNQMRRYRNWVAHGRRGKQPDAVTPETARDRLGRFLAQMTVARPTPSP